MKSKYFKVYELVPQHIYEKYGEKAWRFIDPMLIEAIDAIKARFPDGSMTINNYYWNGSRNWSGLRTPASPDYRETSMHSLGKAIDAVFSVYDVNDVREYIISNPIEFPHIRGIEIGIDWLHIDVRNEDTVQIFRP